MSKVYVITNQHGHFINKHREWVDGRDPKLLFRNKHKDEAVNLVFELSSKDISLRAEAIAVDLDDRDQPIVEVTSFIPTAKEIEAETADNTDGEGSATEPPDDATAAADATAGDDPEAPDAPQQEALAAH